MNDTYANNAVGYISAAGQVGFAQSVDANPTVGENLDKRIAYLRSELERLEKSRESLAPLLNMRIRDIRDAMNY